MSHFRLFLLSLIVVAPVVVVSCQHGPDKSLPDDALSPELIQSPATGSSSAAKKNSAVITFDKDLHDFGRVSEGEKVSYSFHFRNTGDADLLIRNAQASCGCTVPEWPKDPIAPGDEGTITVTFNSEGKSGVFKKSITILSNTIPNTTNLTITGDVEKE